MADVSAGPMATFDKQIRDCKHVPPISLWIWVSGSFHTTGCFECPAKLTVHSTGWTYGTRKHELQTRFNQKEQTYLSILYTKCEESETCTPCLQKQCVSACPPKCKGVCPCQRMETSQNELVQLFLPTRLTQHWGDIGSRTCTNGSTTRRRPPTAKKSPETWRVNKVTCNG